MKTSKYKGSITHNWNKECGEYIAFSILIYAYMRDIEIVHININDSRIEYSTYHFKEQGSNKVEVGSFAIRSNIRNKNRHRSKYINLLYSFRYQLGI